MDNPYSVSAPIVRDLSTFRVGSSKPKTTNSKKGPGGIAGFLVNNLPAITSGIGAVGGSFIAPGAGTIGGGAAGGAVGEALKRKILGQKEDLGQIAIQGVEGGVLSSIGGAGRGLKAGAEALTQAAAKTTGKAAAKTAVKATEKKAGGRFLDNLTTQGQQAQGRVTGVSAGSKVAGKELVPQDTERMLNTLKGEGINTGNANNTLRDVTSRLKNYGKQIDEHFKLKDAPLHPEDTRTIANTFVQGLKTTDPGVLKQAEILAADLQKNVKSTKDLWAFRRTLDKRIPDTKFMDTATTNKVAALKDMRQYIANELGDIPGAKQYHDLAEIKPFVSAEARRLNNPGGGIVGRVLASGPAQKLESMAGKTAERIGAKGAKVTPQAIDTMATAAPDASFMQKIIGTAANPIANPGQTAKAIVKQEAGRGFGVPAAVAQEQQTPVGQSADVSQGILDDGSDMSGLTPQATSPFDPSNIESNVEKIIAQGGKMKDVAEFLANAKAFNELTAASGGGSSKPISATAADAIANAQAGLTSLDQIEQELNNNPGVQGKEALTQTFNPFGITGRATGTSAYDTAITQAKDVIARLRTGAAISNSEEARFTKMLPQPADPPETVQQKLSLLRTALGTVVQRVGGNSSDILQEAAANQ